MKKKSCIQFVELSNRRKMVNRMIYDEIITETRYDLKDALIPFLPKNALDEVVAMLKKYPVILRIETPRKELLGYCDWGQHIIGINNDLGSDRFLTVFIHEYAHLLTHLSFPKAAVHGIEFYYCFQELVLKFISKNIIPKDRFMEIVNRSGDYEMYKKHFTFTFNLKTIRVGGLAVYGGEKIIRNKGRQGFIDCIRVSDNAKIKLRPGTEVMPVFDFSW